MRRAVILSVGAVALGAAVAFAVYRRIGDEPARFDQDPERVARLQHASLTLPVANAGSSDWPQWRGPARDGVANAPDFFTDWPAKGPPLLWRATMGPEYSCPAVVQGRVYLHVQDGDDEAAICRAAETGQEIWRSCSPAPRAKDLPGPRATPAVDHGKVYTLGSTGTLRCLDADSGHVDWSIDLALELGTRVPKWGMACSPLVDGDRVFVIAGGAAGHGIAAFDKHSGRLVWHAGDDFPGYSSPVLATLAGRPQLVCLTGEAVLGMTPEDGTVCWRQPWPTDRGVNVATPVCAGNYVLISAAYHQGCTLLEIAEENGALHARPVYSHNRLRCHFSSPVLHEDHVYAFDDALLTCMDLRTGALRWKERGFGKGSLLIAGGQLVVLGEQGNLALAPAAPAGFYPTASFRASPRKCWTMPVLAGGRLYVRDEEELQCFDLRKAAAR